ncbi:MAG TPA: type II toxin-antitoxin system RelE/ParE family toxin [Candidatus Methylomirabilis sp.]|jgi:mRNA interferase RelE/StbE
MPRPRDARLSRRAEKTLQALDERYRDHLKEAIRELAANPLLGKKLKGEFEGLRSYRLGSFRIVYRFRKELLDVVHIDHRKDVYR